MCLQVNELTVSNENNNQDCLNWSIASVGNLKTDQWAMVLSNAL